jgi:hypothetical protein
MTTVNVQQRGVPAFFKQVIAVVIVGLVLIGLVTAQVNTRLCEQRAASRDDGRAVWLYLVAREPERRDDPDVVDFVRFLDERLPALDCNWMGEPVEVET